jgi:UDP-glucose 4-epimerase
MKVLVTGGAGFIGSNVVDGLIQAGHQVVVVDDLSSGERANVNPKAVFYEVDIRSPEMPDLMKKEAPDVVNHHAAQISVPDSVSDPMLDADINIRGFLNILEGAVACDVRKVIFISSGGAIYGEATEYPTSEDCFPRPLSPYAVAKYASEYYLAYYRHQHGLDYTTLRYANIYGPRQIPHGEAGVVAIFMDNLINGAPSILYHFPENEEGMIRDYCYVGDVVRANIAALERASGEFVNIGTAVGTPTLTLYRIIVEAFRKAGWTIPRELESPEKRGARPGDLTRSCLVAGKAQRLLGWTAATELTRGIEKTLAWRLEQGGG